MSPIPRHIILIIRVVSILTSLAILAPRAVAMEKELLRISEVAELLGLSRATVYVLISNGQIGPLIKVGSASRLRLTDVRAWVQEQADAARSRAEQAAP